MKRSELKPGDVILIKPKHDEECDEIVRATTAGITSTTLPVRDDRPDTSHYKALNPEPIDVIDAWELGYHLGNAVKYISRAGRKDPSGVADLRKAVTYIERAIAAREGRRAWK